MDAGELLMVRNVLDAVATGNVDMEDVVGALEIVEASIDALNKEEEDGNTAAEVSDNGDSPDAEEGTGPEAADV